MTMEDRPEKGSAARPRPNRRVVSKRDSPSQTPPVRTDFPVVAIGASAGGLEAFRKLFDALPADSGMAFVLIQHLDPTHASMMVDLLTGHTKMEIRQAADGMRLEREHVYVIPPAAYLSIEERVFKLSAPQERHGARLPLDFFLRSLAAECGERAICVILSGTGSDGSLGLKAVKENGGLVIVQNPDEAAYDGMPRSAIGTGLVDFVMPVGKIPEILISHAVGKQTANPRPDDPTDGDVPDWLGAIIDLLRTRTAHDFTFYKPGTLHRRIERRMATAGIADGARYLDNLRHNPDELELLAKDVLIHVTSFFRDPEAFELLAEQIVPDLVLRHEPDGPLRIWVAGCSTGEETYSIAMLFAEEIAATKPAVTLQVFASDVDNDALAFARNGIYPESIAADVSPERLARFFAREDRGYRVVPELRDVVVFAIQDVLTNPPFSRLDLISCRNLLIYLRPEAQEKVLLVFDFALRDGGVLFLGGAETVTNCGDRFEAISKQHRIYRHVGRGRTAGAGFPIGSHGNAGARVPLPGERRAPLGPSPRDLTQRALVDAYAPAAVLINRKGECLYFSGATDRYLRVAAGEPSRDLLAMVREGLRSKLGMAIRQAGGERARAVVTGARVGEGDRSIVVSIDVQPIQREGETLLLVSFVNEPERERRTGPQGVPADATSRITELERELEAARRELQSAIRDLEISSAEQTAINEEAMSVNEEFQSTNEELVSSKEELQALNEELTALNSQLQETLERQRSTSNDLQNILDSAGVATLFLDSDLNIRFFTPAAKSLFRVIATDIGRPLADLTALASDPDLIADARTVLTRFAPVGREIMAENDAWYIRRVLPYRTQDNQIEGVVITFADISEMKAAEREIQAARAYSDSIIDTTRQPLVVLDDRLCIVSANRSFYRTFAVEEAKAAGKPLETIAGRHPDAAELRAFLEQVQIEPSHIEDYEAEIELPGLGRRLLLLNGRKLREGQLGQRQILLAIDDITESRRAAEILSAAKREADQANLGKSRFLAAASHDLRQPLQTLSFLQGILAKSVTDERVLRLIDRLDETVKAMSGMLDTLLDINQLEAGIVRRDIVDFPVNAVLDELRRQFAHSQTAGGLDLRVAPSSLSVRSDPRLLTQMIGNLVSNAIKYTEVGKVLLGCRRHGDKLRIEVWDTGIGIPAEQLSAIFEEFHQLDNPARERSKGVGLGLAIVQRLADLLDHTIDVRSSPGKGSVFSIEVPMGVAEPTARPQLDTPQTQTGTGLGRTILVVEDEPVVREMLTLLLESEGYRTESAADGGAALALATRGVVRPDLVLADYNLPNGPNGLQVVASLQEILGRDIKAIILSGDISTNTLREIARAGRAYLGKPVTTSALIGLIEELLAKPQPAAEADDRPPAIFVVDDDSTVREALRDLLEADGRAVEIYDSCEAFLDIYRPGRRGCLVVDARMPGMGGLELLQRLQGERHRLPAIMITGHGDVPMAVQAMKAGAVDFIEKPIGHKELLTTIERALEQAGDTAKASAWRETAASSIAGLTARQRQIMDLVLAGHPSKNIAADLGVSQRTVENHRAAVMKKTGSRSIPALIRLALAAGV
jgi:two-component system, chemotaxis family, CheB/CheR fusion protein